MSSNKDKRKANRIQGGWSKTNENKKTSCEIIFEAESKCNSGDLIPKFNSNVVGEVCEKCKIIEIKKDISMNLNINLSEVQLESVISPANVQYIKSYMLPDDATNLCEYFLHNLPWKQRENATPSGQKYMEPRKTCWYGLPYAYSSIKMPPNQNWDPKLKELLDRVQPYSGNKAFNSVMCNLYVDAKNSIDWHADDEVSLGDCPTIASISLGCTRAFEICYRPDLYVDFKNKSKNPYRSRNKDEPPFDGCSILYRVFLESGSLLVMSGSMQQYWLHRVPKEYHDQSPRINFTFRYIKEDEK